MTEKEETQKQAQEAIKILKEAAKPLPRKFRNAFSGAGWLLPDLSMRETPNFLVRFYRAISWPIGRELYFIKWYSFRWNQKDERVFTILGYPKYRVGTIVHRLVLFGFKHKLLTTKNADKILDFFGVY